MVHRPTPSQLSLAAVSLFVAACGGGSNVSNASPRVDAVPQQSTTGASAFSLDLAAWVSDREGQSLTYAVESGGGSFAGSVYSNTFDTMGEYTVDFTVSDGMKTTRGSIPVRVTAANFAVVREDTSGLLLLDTRTEAFLRIAGAAPTPSLAAGLPSGRLAYHLAAPAGQQLWLFDPLKRTNTRLAAQAGGDVTLRASTSDGRLVYTTGSGNDLELFSYNPTTGVVREIAEGVLASVTVAVNADDLVFHEVGVAGQADVYAYDPAADEVFAVGTAATDEQIQAVLPNGGVVFTRVGAGGEADLMYYRVGTGLVEIGLDVTGLDTRTKTFHGFGSGSQVVFGADNGGDHELFHWNPADGQTTTIASGADHGFDAIAAGNEVVYHVVVSGSEQDVFFHDLDDDSVATVRDAADVSAVLGVTSDGTTSWALLRPSGATSSLLAVSLVATPATQTWAAGGAVSTTVGLLANGDVVGRRADGAALNVFDVSAGTWGSAIAGSGLAFAGDGIDDGDFVYSLTAGGQTDLSMWDASASAQVVVSDTAGNDVFQILTADGTVLFTRVVSGNSNADLFVWDGSTATRLTAADGAGLLHDHTVLGKYAGSR